jgi:high-affinity nickel permease
VILRTKKDKAYSFSHTQARLKERYDLHITRSEYDEICVNAKALKGELERNGEKMQKIVKAKFKGKMVTFVYGLGCDYVMTVLPS